MCCVIAQHIWLVLGFMAIFNGHVFIISIFALKFGIFNLLINTEGVHHQIKCIEYISIVLCKVTSNGVLVCEPRQIFRSSEKIKKV